MQFRLEGHQEPRNEVRSLSPAERLVRLEPGTFRLYLQRLETWVDEMYKVYVKFMNLTKLLIP